MMPQTGIKLYKSITTWMSFWDRNASVGKETSRLYSLEKKKKRSVLHGMKSGLSMETPEPNLSCFTKTGNALQCSGWEKMTI